MKTIRFTLALLAAFFVACDEGSLQPLPGVDRLDPSIEQTDYEQVRITDNGAVMRSLRDVQRVGFGTIDDGSYIEQRSVDAVWELHEGMHLLRFDVSVDISARVRFVTLRMRMYRTNGTTQDFDRRIPTNGFPYRENAFVVASSSFPGYPSFRDIAVVDGSVYIRAVGLPSLFTYSVSTGVASVMDQGGVPLSLNYQVAADDRFVYTNTWDNRLVRWDAGAGRFDRVVHAFAMNSPAAIRGIATDRGSVYVLLRESTAGSASSLVRLTPDGVVQDSVVIGDVQTRFIGVRDGVLYVVKYGETADRIDRYDMRTWSQLDPVLAPTRWIEGIEIAGSYLYYVDGTRNQVGKVRLSHLQAVLLSFAPSADAPDRGEPR